MLRTTCCCWLAISQLGCSVLLAGNVTQCDTDADCQAGGEASSGARCEAQRCVEPVEEPVPEPPLTGWECVGKLEPIRTDFEKTVSLELRFTDLKSAGRPGLAVNYCYTLDPTCSPVAPSDTLSDAEGRATLEVPWGMHGIVIVQGNDDVVPTLVYIDPPPTTPISTIVVPILDVQSVAIVGTLTGNPIDPAAGTVLMSAPDCTLKYNPLTPGVSYTLQKHGPSTVQFYLVNQLPDTTATQTGSSSVGGFANVPPGIAHIDATLPDLDDLKIGQANFLVRKSWLTYATISPYDQ